MWRMKGRKEGPLLEWKSDDGEVLEWRDERSESAATERVAEGDHNCRAALLAFVVAQKGSYSRTELVASRPDRGLWKLYFCWGHQVPFALHRSQPGVHRSHHLIFI